MVDASLAYRVDVVEAYLETASLLVAYILLVVAIQAPA